MDLNCPAERASKIQNAALYLMWTEFSAAPGDIEVRGE
jgi:hypothetical protein